MPDYSAPLVLQIPTALVAIGAAIGRSLDPDSGGADSFSPMITGYQADGITPIYGPNLQCSTLCDPTWLAEVQALMADTTGAALFAAVSADYAARWATLTPPTQAQCQQFIQGVIVPQPG